jgi:spermidine synthase
MPQTSQWFTEEHQDAGSAFGMRIEGLLEQVQTPYQKIEIYQTTDFGRLMVIDGCVMLTSRDNFLYHEMMSHPVLFTHPDPRRVAIVGGGDCGTLREVLRHTGVQEVVQIDIDEQVTRLSERHFPELCESNADPRASLLFEDGIRWIREREPGSLDVIIIDSTDPVGPAEGLFTADFLADCHKALGDGGILVQQSESPLYHMDILRGLYQAMDEAGFAAVQTLFFPQCVYPSGWWSATMARKGQGFDGFREQAVQQRSFPTRYYNLDIHRAALAQPEFFRTEIQIG